MVDSDAGFLVKDSLKIYLYVTKEEALGDSKSACTTVREIY